MLFSQAAPGFHSSSLLLLPTYDGALQHMQLLLGHVCPLRVPVVGQLGAGEFAPSRSEYAILQVNEVPAQGLGGLKLAAALFASWCLFES